MAALLVAGGWSTGTTTASPAGAATVRPAAADAAGLVQDPSSLVDPIDGTGTGPVDPGTVGEFPGADVPFGMIQWSPDTQPDTVMSGGLYSYADDQVSGFSLDHLSGTGCQSYGDVPILPTVGALGADPESATDTFSHAAEHAAPGQYGVTLGPSGVSTQLAVTTRTGLSRFTFPRTGAANVLFKVAGSSNPVINASVHLDGHDGISGEVESGQFCGTGTNYTLYFAAQFNRPFTSAGSWNGPVVSPGVTSCAGANCGSYVTFDARSDRTVLMKVGISFVSVRNAADNLRVEDPGWSLGRVESRATGQWNSLLDRVRVGGGTSTEQRTFYTALYHSLLDPDVVSDDNGEYTGEDGQVHRADGGAQYANFSEWDIYRSEIQLVSLVAPRQAGAMVQSLVDDAAQDGWLPKWAIADGDESQMNGDSADPIIADAYAFGVRNVDVDAALAAMAKGATETETGHGLEIERQYLDQYLTQHYVNADSLDLTSIDYSIGGSVTLEYAIDDFSIAQMAKASGDHALYETMMQRAHNWEYLFNPATGYIGARSDDGSFPPGPAFQASQLEPGGQLGFEEGNAVQYTWSVPQDLAALSNLMGGDAATVAKLNTFFTSLNATRNLPYDWAGNEPSLWTPWEYDYFAAPSQTQGVVRDITDTLYSDTPVDEPGNDDLGAIASWYVWAAIGMYPVTPGTANLALASPLFPQVVMTLPDGHQLVIDAPAASASTPYVHSLTVSGVGAPTSTTSCPPAPSSGAAGWNQPWLPSSVIRTGGVLTFGLGSTPDPSWGAGPGSSPPSYGTGLLPVVGFTTPGGGTTVAAGQPTTVQLGAALAGTSSPTIQWSATGTGLDVSPASGRLVLDGPPAHSGRRGSAACPAAAAAPATAPASERLTLTAPTAGSYVLDIHLQTAGGTTLPPVVLDVDATG
jgi:predicted alpha-1,2-mannosidase